MTFQVGATADDADQPVGGNSGEVAGSQFILHPAQRQVVGIMA